MQEAAEKKASYHYQMGVSKLGESDATGALIELTEAEKLKPDDPAILYGLARAYFEKKKFLIAEEKYLAALKLKPDNSAVRNDLGVNYLEMKRWDEAINQFKLAINDIFFQGHNEAKINLGLAYLGKNDHDAALGEFRKLIPLIPRDPRPRYYMGMVYAAMDKNELASGEFKKAVELYPEYTLAYYQQGLVSLKLKLNAQAAAAFREVVRLAPDSEVGQLSREQLDQLK